MGNQNSAPSSSTLPASFNGIAAAFNTWKNSYSNLFDYSNQAGQHTLSSIMIQQQCGVVKAGEEFKIITGNSNPQNVMLRLTKHNNFYMIEPPINYALTQIWVAVKSLPNQRYKLKEGDILRIAKQFVKVKEIILEGTSDQNGVEVKTKYKVYEKTTKQQSQGYNPDSGSEQPLCRVCMQQGQINNPLIAPCKCSGSAKFIHIKCIQEWFNKITNPHKINASVVLNWKPLICQLCSEPLPFKVYFDDIKYFTVDIPRPQKPYIVLNPMDNKEKSKSRLYHLVSFKNKKYLNIGRKRQADIVFDEQPTISRFHSAIQMIKIGNKQNFYLSDKQSKFGTLVLLRKSINLQGKFSGITLQISGSTITFTYNEIENNENKKQFDINSEDENQQQESEEQNENAQKT